MKAYIRSTGNISPQPTYDPAAFLEDVREFDAARLTVAEPDYKQFIQPNQLRRMSRLLKMGVTAAGICLKEAGIEKPDAIITGTGLGMMEETEKFLNGLLDNGEQLLNPTPFIQSTHNTVGASIAVMLGCNNYNLTYVHGPVSFENALLDSLMWLAEKPGANILLGGIEEITQKHFEITESMGFWKTGSIRNIDLLGDKRPGTLAGEGAAFFLLTDQADPANYARIEGLSTRFNPGKEDKALDFLNAFLQQQNLPKENIDVVILGLNSDPHNDAVYRQVTDYFGNSTTLAYYKHLCGDHYLASSFALWLGAKIARHGHVPQAAVLKSAAVAAPVKNILILNHAQNLHHSFIHLTSC